MADLSFCILREKVVINVCDGKKLGDPGGRVAGALVKGCAFTANTPQLAEGVQLPILPAKAKGARGGNHRVFELHPSYLYS